jgi:hypothetical protein
VGNAMPREMDPGPFEVRLPLWVRLSEWVIERMLCGLRPKRRMPVVDGWRSDCPTYGRERED